MKARRLLLAAALAAAPAFAQQNVDISGADFQSGAGDAKLATLGREAAKSGKRIVVTAPQEWHAKIAAKIRGGGSADVVLRDGFYENVLVRVEDKPAEPAKETAKAEAKPEPRPEPKAARAAAERVPVDVPGPKPTLPPPVPAPQPAPVVSAPPPVATPAPAAAPAPPAVKQAPATAVAKAAPVPAAPPKPDIAKIQQRMEQSLNNGREAEGPLSVSGLQGGDFIFVDGPVRAVVRRESLRPRMFWLDGDLDLRRTELKELSANRYQVIEPLRGENYSLREDRSEQAKSLVAAEPPANSPARATFERDYNDGHPIANSITVDKLRSGDLVYAGKGAAVVVRREGQTLSRFWLDGTLDLLQSGLQKDGANKYKVVSDTLR